MKRRIAFFVITALIAMLVVTLINSALKKKQETIEALRNSQTMVVVAASALQSGARLSLGNTKLATWPRDTVPPGAFNNPREVAGRIVRQTVVENQPIVPALLVSGDKSGGVLPLLIPAGMRAMSIPVTAVSDMAGMLLPTARVDVLVSTSIGESSSNNERTRIVLQNVEVLAVQTTLDNSSNAPQRAEVVTLLVTPADAERLAAASRLGTLQLALRNYADQLSVPTTGVDVAQLLGEPTTRRTRPPVKAERIAAEPVRKVIEVLRNGKTRQMVSVEDGAVFSVHPQIPAAGRELAPR